MLASGHMAGTVTIPGHVAAPAECPADLLEKEPDLPKLNIMVARSDLYPEVPGAVVRQWVQHEFGPEFQRFLDQVHEEHGPIPDATTGAAAAASGSSVAQATEGGEQAPGVTPPTGSGRKRKAANSGVGSATKMGKVDREKILPTSEPELV